MSLSNNSHRQLIYREVGTESHPPNLKGRDSCSDPGVLALGGIVLNGQTELHIFDRGSTEIVIAMKLSSPLYVCSEV